MVKRVRPKKIVEGEGVGLEDSIQKAIRGVKEELESGEGSFRMSLFNAFLKAGNENRIKLLPIIEEILREMKSG